MDLVLSTLRFSVYTFVASILFIILMTIIYIVSNKDCEFIIFLTKIFIGVLLLSGLVLLISMFVYFFYKDIILIVNRFGG